MNLVLFEAFLAEEHRAPESVTLEEYINWLYRKNAEVAAALRLQGKAALDQSLSPEVEYAHSQMPN